MKKIFVALLFLLPLSGNAETVSLNFRDVSVVTFAESTYKTILQQDYIVAPQVLTAPERITMSISSMDKKQLPALLENTLAGAGIAVSKKNGIFYLTQKSVTPTMSAPAPLSTDNNTTITPADDDENPPEPIDFEVYYPAYRPVAYLQSALQFAGLSSSAQPAGEQTIRDALIVSGTQEQRLKMNKLLLQLDTKPAVLNVRAALIEFSDSNDSSLSISQILGTLSSKLTVSINSIAQPLENVGRIKTGSIDSVLGAMNGDSRFSFKTQPYLRLVDGETGRLQVGSDVPVRGAITVLEGGQQQLQSTEYRPSGLVLTITPRVMKNRIQAHVIQEVSSFAPTTTSAIDSPTLNKRSIEAVIDAEDDEVVLLGGLDEVTESDSRSRLFNWFTTGKNGSKRNTQLMVLIEFKRI